jgi:nitrogen regulatory protein PII
MANQVKLIIAIVNRGFAESVMDAAREQGATGGTILHGRGSEHAVTYLNNLSFDPEKELVLILSRVELTKKIMEGIFNQVGLGTPGSGICFALPVDDVVGINMFRQPLEKKE